jgi:hypothetical protein
MNRRPPPGVPGIILSGGSARALPRQMAVKASTAIKIVRPFIASVLSCRLRADQKNSAET